MLACTCRLLLRRLGTGASPHAAGVHASPTTSCWLTSCRPAPLAPLRSFVSYLGPFNKEFREVLLLRDFVGCCTRLGIPVTKDLKVGGVGL